MTLHVPNITAPAQSQLPAEAASASTPQISGRLACLRRETSGQDLIEYALAAALIGLSAVSGMSGLAANISNALDGVGNAVANAIPTSTTPPTAGPSNPLPPPGGDHHHDHH